MESCILSYSLSDNLCSLQHRGFIEGSIKNFQTLFILMVFGLFFQTPSSEVDVRNVKLKAAQTVAVQADAERELTIRGPFPPCNFCHKDFIHPSFVAYFWDEPGRPFAKVEEPVIQKVFAKQVVNVYDEREVYPGCAFCAEK